MKIPNSYIFGNAADRSSWTEREIKSLCEKAVAQKDAMAALPLGKVIGVLAKAGRLFADKKSPWRKKALANLRESVSFSEETLGLTLDILPSILSEDELYKRTRLELFLPDALEKCVTRNEYEGYVTAAPKGVVLHVGAGNVFLGVVDSLVMGLLTRNVNIVKISSRGSRFPVLFAQAVRECDDTGVLASSFAITSWPGGDAAIENAVLNRCDAVFVWGGEDAVSAYRKNAPARVHVTGFGPKMSLGIATYTALRNYGVRPVAEAVVQSASVWDQSACASPHTLYLVCPDKKERKKLLDECVAEIAAAFAKKQRELPQGKLGTDEHIEILKARELAKVDAAEGKAVWKSSFPRSHWTVIGSADSDFSPSPLNRVLYVKCAASIEEIAEKIKRYKGYMQTVGIAAPSDERRAAARLLARHGIARVTMLGKMLEAPAGSPHDGIFPMRELVSFIGIEGADSKTDALAELAMFAKANSPFYGRHFAGLEKPTTMAEFQKFPLLTKNDILKNTPPQNFDMFTGPIKKGIYFASGGSTGSPKYIFYDFDEYEKTGRMLGQAMIHAGLGDKDRAANLFVSGNLWSSFLSVEHALRHTQAISIPIGSALPMETILGFLNEFKATALVGLPSFLLKLAENVEAAGGKYSIPVKYIFYGGEYVGPETAAYFKKIFPGVSVRSAAYATVDAGVIGYQCPHCEKGVHHLFNETQYLEILDTETLQPAKEGELGEIVVTPLGKRHMPIIRFRLGDLGRWITGPCPCGRKAPRFEIIGRCDDRIHIGGAHLFLTDIEKAVGSVPELSLSYQIEIGRRAHKEQLTVRVETKKPAPEAKTRELAARLMAAVKKNCEDLDYSISHSWLDIPEIEILPPGGIERSARTGKIKKVLDLRI